MDPPEANGGTDADGGVTGWVMSWPKPVTPGGQQGAPGGAPVSIGVRPVAVTQAVLIERESGFARGSLIVRPSTWPSGFKIVQGAPGCVGASDGNSPVGVRQAIEDAVGGDVIVANGDVWPAAVGGRANQSVAMATIVKGVRLHTMSGPRRHSCLPRIYYSWLVGDGRFLVAEQTRRRTLAPDV